MKSAIRKMNNKKILKSFFCGKNLRRKEGRKQRLSHTFFIEENIEKNRRYLLNDTGLFDKLPNGDQSSNLIQRLPMMTF